MPRRSPAPQLSLFDAQADAVGVASLDDEGAAGAVGGAQVPAAGRAGAGAGAGGLSVREVDVKSILSPASGFIGAFDYTLNPYTGCTFGCSYCYAAFFTHDRARQDDWGRWVDVKQNAVARLQAMRKPLHNARIYASSVTDPYQPIEKKTQLFRALLEALVEHQPRLTIQTRSALVVRDIDVLRKFEHLRVNLTVTTDDDAVRRAFEPMCPPNSHRLQAAKQLVEAGVRTAITMTPLLPVHDAHAFAASLLQTGAEHFVVQPFHATKGRFVAGTGEAARAAAAERGWDEAAYEAVRAVLAARLPSLAEGRDGFAPI